ncbi:MAG: FAD:protein FMN transferase, partial [Oscillospiraceae bacterium]|nr:FAD:protein FMN transferase [Oscillospiraceae bacterium]
MKNILKRITEYANKVGRGESRMSRMPLILIAIAMLLPMFSLYFNKQKDDTDTPYTVTEYLFDTYCTITVYDTPSVTAASAVKNAFAQLRDLDILCDIYNPKSELAKLNENAATAPVKVSDNLYDLIYIALEFCKETDSQSDT